MAYLKGNIPALGDRVQHVSGQTGTVAFISNHGIPGIHELSITWDNAAASLRLVKAREFKLISRAVTKKAISRPRLAEMLIARRTSKS
jgi:hypothetical protein